MNDPFANSKYSVRHAKRHIKSLEVLVNDFVASNPYARVIDVDPDGPHDVHKVRLIKEMPDALSGVAFDAAINLRRSLDQAGFTVAVAAGGNGKDAHFPFGDTAAEVQSRRAKPSSKIPEKIFDVMAAFEPHKGGNAALWALNKICNSEKHEIITPAAMSVGAISLTNTKFRELRGLGFPPKWDSAKNEMEIVRVAQGADCYFDLKMTMYIAFGNIDAIAGYPALAVLDHLAGQAEAIIDAVALEARSIGLFN